MASAVYPKYKEALLGSGGPNLDTGDIRVIIVDLADYTYNAAHDFLDDVPAAARVAVSSALANTTITDGVFNADPKTLTAVTGDTSEALVLYNHTGTDSTSRLILFVDQASAGLPFTPNGGDVTITWDTGTNKIFKL